MSEDTRQLVDLMVDGLDFTPATVAALANNNRIDHALVVVLNR